MSMTNEQREAIKTMQHWIEYEKEHQNEINKAEELIHIQDTVLSLIKEQQAEMQQKNKQIDLMADKLVEAHEWFYSGFDNFTKEDFIQYFERKVEDVKD